MFPQSLLGAVAYLGQIDLMYSSLTPRMNSVQPSWRAPSQHHAGQGLGARERTEQTWLQAGLLFLTHCTEAGSRIKPGALQWYAHCSGTSPAAAAAMKHVHRRIMKFSCLDFGIWWKASLDPRGTFYPSLQSPWLWQWGGTFALSTIRISLQCSKHCSRPTPPRPTALLLPPEGGGLLVFHHPPHIHAPFPRWHLLALPVSM